MAENVKWIKIVTDIFDNEKIRMIEALPEGDAIIVIWLKILTLAGKTNSDGFLYFVEEVPYTEQMLATYFGKPLTIIQLALSTFEKFKMIEIIDDAIRVSNWERYQNIEGLERIREQTRKRVAKFRETQKERNVSCNVTVTPSNVIDKDIDIDIDIYKNTCANEREKEAQKEAQRYSSHFEEFWDTYSKKRDKAQAYKCYNARLKEGYSEEELLSACKNYMEECKREKREQRYIKDAKTFLGVNTPFVDFLPRKPKTDQHGRHYEDGLLVWNIDFPESEAPPFYGAPEEWFENGQLIESRVTAVRQPALPKHGIYKPQDKTKEYVLETINFRRSYFERKGNSG